MASTPANSDDVQERSRLNMLSAQRVALVIIVAFLIYHFISFAAAILADNNQFWENRLEDSSASLTLAFTTVIGFYFGRQGIEEAEERSLQAREGVKVSEEEKIEVENQLLESQRELHHSARMVQRTRREDPIEIEQLLYKPEDFQIQITTRGPPIIKKTRYTERIHKRIRIFIDVTDKTNEAYLDNVVYVKYTLHPTYTIPERTATDRTKKFEIQTTSYGSYNITAEITLKDDQIIRLVKMLPYADL